MALHALSEYAILSYVGGVNLTISLASTNLDFQETFELNRDNKKLLQSAKVIRKQWMIENLLHSDLEGSLTGHAAAFRLFVWFDSALSN